MPISARGEYSEEHWVYMKSVYQKAARDALGAEVHVDLVSEAEETGLIHERIVSNIYRSDILIGDVSGGYPNVFLEIGLGLAWDKPLVLVKDDKSKIEFDIGGLEHTIYESSRSVPKFDNFREKLEQKIRGTFSAAEADPSYSPFLQAFLRRQGIESQDKGTAEASEVIESIQQKLGLLEKKANRPPFKEYKPRVVRNSDSNSVGMDEGEILKLSTNIWIYDNVFNGIATQEQIDQLVTYLIGANPLTMRHGERPQYIREQAIKTLTFFGVQIQP